VTHDSPDSEVPSSSALAPSADPTPFQLITKQPCLPGYMVILAPTQLLTPIPSAVAAVSLWKDLFLGGGRSYSFMRQRIGTVYDDTLFP
jgi:hypothetical protein